MLQGGGRRQGLWVRPPLPPLPLYRHKRGGRAQPCPFLQGRGAAKRGGGVHPPQGTSEVPSPLWTLPSPSLLGAWAYWGWCPWPIWANAHPLQPMFPPGAGGPPPPPPVDPRTPFGTPGTIPIKCETFPATKIRLPIYKSLPPYHSGTPHDVQDLIRDSEQYSVCCILIFIQP